MGTDPSKEKEGKKEEKKKLFKIDDTSLKIDNMSSYNGVQSEDQSESVNDSTNKENGNKKPTGYRKTYSQASISFTGEEVDSTIANSNTLTNSNQNNVETEKKPFLFQWPFGGTNVYIAAQFLKNWAVNIKMEKNPATGIFEYKANLPIGQTHQFKFCVDGKWEINKNYYVIRRGNNMNNILDWRNEKKDEKEKKKENNENKMEEEDNDEKERLMREKEKNKAKEMQKTYGIYYPNESMFNSNLPSVPENYCFTFDIDYMTNQNELKKKYGDFLYYQEQNLLSENNSYKKILRVPHVNLNHLCMPNNIDTTYYKSKKTDEKFIKLCESEKKKNKIITYIYYVPNIE